MTDLTDDDIPHPDDVDEPAVKVVTLRIMRQENRIIHYHQPAPWLSILSEADQATILHVAADMLKKAAVELGPEPKADPAPADVIRLVDDPAA